MAELEPGDPFDEKTTLAPLSSEQAAELVIEQVNEAIEKGAGVVTGGRRIDRPGAFVEPTILVDLTPEMRLPRGAVRSDRRRLPSRVG